MANTQTNTTAIWIDNGANYTGPRLNHKQQLVLCIHALALQLATVNSGVAADDYITLGFEQLIQDSDALNRYLNPDAIRAAEVAARYADAENAGADLSALATTDAKLAAAVKLLHYDDERLERAKLFLKSKLGYHSSF